jgi:uncharacterized protein (DUF433 family)/predicted nuclease of predicted toxin-antitoxin system
MEISLQVEAPPLRQDASGALRIGHSHVLLELVIRAFQDGATPEAIAQRYSTATLADIYAAIAYYLRHREAMEAYLAEREQLAQEVRQRLANHQGDLADLRGRLLARQRRAWGWRMLRLLSDENFNGDIVRGLLLRRPELDLRRVQDVGLEEADDPTILAWAAAHNRILLTHDRATMPDFAYTRIVTGQPMPGVFVVNDRTVVRQALDELLLLDACSEQAEWAGLVVYLPL